jgi:hypothetical protein
MAGRKSMSLYELLLGLTICTILLLGMGTFISDLNLQYGDTVINPNTYANTSEVYGMVSGVSGAISNTTVTQDSDSLTSKLSGAFNAIFVPFKSVDTIKALITQGTNEVGLPAWLPIAVGALVTLTVSFSIIYLLRGGYILK